LFSFSIEAQVRHRSCERVCAGWLEVQNLSTKDRVEDCCRKELHRVKGFKYFDVFEECRKECVQKSLRRFEFVKGNSGGFIPSKCSRGGKEPWSLCSGQVQEKDYRVNLEPEIFEEEVWTTGIPREEFTK
jgi:hypothetical protein